MGQNIVFLSSSGTNFNVIAPQIFTPKCSKTQNGDWYLSKKGRKCMLFGITGKLTSLASIWC